MIVFDTKRMYLRKMKEDDVGILQEILADPIAMKYYPKTFDEDEIKAWIAKVLYNYNTYNAGLWMCHLKETDEFVGMCGLSFPQNLDGRDEVEVGYLFVRRFWKQGLATEAAHEAMQYARNVLGYTRLISLIRPENLPSRAVAERNGLIPEKEVQYKNLQHLVYVSHP